MEDNRKKANIENILNGKKKMKMRGKNLDSERKLRTVAHGSLCKLKFDNSCDPFSVYCVDDDGNA